MDINSILFALRAERDRISGAIAALEGLDRGDTKSRHMPKTVHHSDNGRGGRRMSAAARKRMSEMMKQRWASGKMSKKR
jgi:hypothetical protein